MNLQTSAVPFSPAVLGVFQEAAQVFRPPPKMTVCEWAERERVLSTESSAEPGRYRVARASYQRGMQDAINLPGVEEVVFMTSAQIGKSLCLENILGYFAHEDPCPLIWMWPTLEVAKSWSVDTLGPMLRDTPALQGLVTEGGRKTANSTLFKKFTGGWLAVIGANSPGTLRRRRARVVIADEVDSYPASAGPEGDPILLVAKRSTTFWNRVRILSSTPTLRGASRIEGAYEASDRRKFWVPCPQCSEASGEVSGFQVLQWKRLILDKAPPHVGTVYACEHCGAALTEFDKSWMLAHGEWRAERPEVVKIAGFWINELYSPFVTWAEMASAFLNAVAHRENPELLKTFINLSLGETWEDRDEQLDREELIKRAEDYPPGQLLPRDVVVVTAGVDVQPDRIEIELVGWGRGEESWSLDFARLEGDTALLEVWAKLDQYLEQRFWHSRASNDLSLPIAAAFIDSGFRAGHVYAFTKTRGERRVFASKGISGFNRAPVNRWNRNNQARVKLYPVAVDVVKEMIYSRLRIATPGAGYMHFSREKNDQEYFNQLTAEQLKRKYAHGFPVRFWELPPGKRNEALDCRVYATAALHSLVERTPVPVLLERLHQQLVEDAKRALAERRAKYDPNQLQLPVEETGSAQPAQPPLDVPAPVVADTEPEPEPPAHQVPTVVQRRSSWV